MSGPPMLDHTPGEVPATRPRIDLVVVTYNSEGEIGGFLDSLDALDGASLRVLVTDNASADATLALARDHPRAVEVIETGANLGYAAAINAAAGHVRDDALLVIANPDVRFRAPFLGPVLAAIAEPGIGIVAPMLVDEHGEPLPSLRRDPAVRRALAEAVLGGHRAGRLGLGELVTEPSAYRREQDASWVTGALLVVTPECRQRVGAWDESFFLYSEETDYQIRVRQAGLRVRYIPRAVAFHRGGASHVDPWLWGTLTRNRVRLFRAYHGPIHTAAFWLAVTLNELVRTPRSPIHRRAARELICRAWSLIVPARTNPVRNHGGSR